MLIEVIIFTISWVTRAWLLLPAVWGTALARFFLAIALRDYKRKERRYMVIGKLTVYMMLKQQAMHIHVNRTVHAWMHVNKTVHTCKHKSASGQNIASNLDAYTIVDVGRMTYFKYRRSPIINKGLPISFSNSFITSFHKFFISEVSIKLILLQICLPFFPFCVRSVDNKSKSGYVHLIKCLLKWENATYVSLS